MKITKSDFGTTNTGENIHLYHMEITAVLTSKSLITAAAL